MSRFARTRRVFFFEEPVFEEGEAHLRSSLCGKTGVHVRTPILPFGLDGRAIAAEQKRLLASMLKEDEVSNYLAWYYTPMAREYATSLRPITTVYDCMDELSAFSGASSAMHKNELALFQEADLVFTGGASLFQSKRKQHAAVYLFPSSVDAEHFAHARTATEPADQSCYSKPRLGYAGVIDERMDLNLIREVAERRPGWQLLFLGPVAKINPASLPQASNIHYLGMKQYAELPLYLSGWEIGMLPFALNESTQFISPTKTPEYLAAGLQVISTPIRDVVSPYGEQGLVGIVDNAEMFVRTGDTFLHQPPSDDFRVRVDNFLSLSSWDKTWSEMNALVCAALASANSEPLHFPSTVTKGVAHV